MASARWRTRDRKNSRPTPPAVPSTTARRACRSSGTAAAADVSPTPVGAWRGSSSNDPAEFASWFMRRLQARELWTKTAVGRSGGSRGRLLLRECCPHSQDRGRRLLQGLVRRCPQTGICLSAPPNDQVGQRGCQATLYPKNRQRPAATPQL